MSKATILIVDDEKLLLQLLIRRLTRLSYTVFSAESGEKALEIIHKENIEVLITDFKMPGMDGRELIARATQIDPDLRSIIISGYSDEQTTEDLLAAGAFRHQTKPIDFNELNKAIEEALTIAGSSAGRRSPPFND